MGGEVLGERVGRHLAAGGVLDHKRPGLDEVDDEVDAAENVPIDATSPPATIPRRSEAF